MTTSTPLGRAILYLLVFLSGAAGLVYQVAWHKYLAILLGAQARATTIVLMIFLGGISAGYYVFGRWTRWKRWNLLLVYALVEVALGFWAFLFPILFRFSMKVMPFSYEVFGLDSLMIDFIFSALLIGFPTFLMGGTLPLLTQGLTEELSEASRTHARIYGFNTVGACLGCLIAGYFLIPSFDLPITVTIGGFLNVLIGLVVYFLFAKWQKPQEVHLDPKTDMTPKPLTMVQASILGIGFFSGFYIIALETVLIRLMTLSTGASSYNFTLIVSVFILGLGIGSLLVREIGTYRYSRLFWNQILVAFGLLLVYMSGDNWSYWVHLLRVRLRDLPENFYFFQLLLGSSFTLLLIIPIGFCGLTLPLCFHLLKDKKESLGERVGQLYGLNTVGSVLGAFLGGYYLLNFFDLDHLFKFCIFCALITVGFAGYLYYRESKPSRLQLGLSGAVTGLILIGIFVVPFYHRERFIQPFRHPEPLEATWDGADEFGKYLSRHTKIVHWDDGPNTSLGVGATIYKGKEVSRTILVNGKSDGNTRGDYFTTIMLAHLPALLSRNLDNTCVIGFGTGVTIGTLAAYDGVKSINVVEISRAILKNIHYYDAYNGGVSTNGKVKFNEMDAFRFLGGGKKKYDLVISEPSNPWVMGIENLYSYEFYEIVKRNLNPGGMIAQWIHSYSFSDDLFRMVLKTMTSQFPYVSVFQLKGGDLVLLGKLEPFSRQDLVNADKRMQQPGIKKNLSEVGFNRLTTLFGLEVVPGPVSRVIASGAELHRLESPKLSNGAAKAFFASTSAYIQRMRRDYKEYYPSLEYSLLSLQLKDETLDLESLEEMRAAFCDSSHSKVRYLCEEVMVMAKLLRPEFDPNSKYKKILTTREVASLAHFGSPTHKEFSEEDLRGINSSFETYKKYASPVARIPLPVLVKKVDYCLTRTAYAAELYGECLLQKILILETATLPGSPPLNSAIQQYLEWFPGLSKKAKNYEKLQDAREILKKMIALTERASPLVKE